MNRLRTPTTLVLVLFLTSCLPALPGFVPTPSVTPPLPTAAYTETPTVAPSPEPTSTAIEIVRPNITRVLIVSIDGLRPDAIDLAPMPTLQGLMKVGAYSLSAQTIFPSTTLPAHASMLTGLCPSAHGVTWDEYLPEKGFAQGTSLFDLAQH